MPTKRPNLYDILMSIKPDNLTLHAWATRAGVNRSWFHDIKKGAAPRTATLEKVVKEAGYTLAQFFDLAPELRESSDTSEVAPKAVVANLPFQGENEPLDLPLLGTAQGSDMEIRDDGTIQFIERMDLDSQHVVEYLRRPQSLAGRRDVYAITVIGSSVAPKYDDGDPAYVDPKRQASAGDYVVVQLVREGEDGEQHLHVALLKKLVRRTSRVIELEQHNPPLRFEVPTEQVHAIHRVIPWREIVFF